MLHLTSMSVYNEGRLEVWYRRVMMILVLVTSRELLIFIYDAPSCIIDASRCIYVVL